MNSRTSSLKRQCDKVNEVIVTALYRLNDNARFCLQYNLSLGGNDFTRRCQEADDLWSVH